MGRNKKNHEAYWRSQIQASNELGALFNELVVHLENISKIAKQINNGSIIDLCKKCNITQNIVKKELGYFDSISDHLGLCMYAKDRIKSKKELQVLNNAEKELAALRGNFFKDINNNLQILKYDCNAINSATTQNYIEIYNRIANDLARVTKSVNNLKNKACNLSTTNFSKNYTREDINRLSRVKYCVNAFCKNKQLDTDKKNLEYILKLENNDTELDRLYNQLGGQTVDVLLASNKACSNYMKLINTRIQLPNYHDIKKLNRYYEKELLSHSAVVEKNNEIIRSISNAGKITEGDIYHINDARNTILKTTEKCRELTNLINDITYSASNLGRPIRSASYVHDNRNLQRRGSAPQFG